MEPVRRGTMPMMDLSVVVLPAPLRPSSVATSPPRTSKSTPCRMCDSPYHACRAATSRRTAPAGCLSGTVAVVTASGMRGPHVSLDHDGVLGDGLVISFGDDAAAGEDGDG